MRWEGVGGRKRNVVLRSKNISGRVLVNVSEPKKMKCLKVEMVGRGEVLVDMDPPLTKDKERDKDKCADVVKRY